MKDFYKRYTVTFTKLHIYGMMLFFASIFSDDDVLDVAAATTPMLLAV